MAKTLPVMTMVLFVGLISVVAEGALSSLPDSSHYEGTSYYAVNLGGGKIQTGRVEFAVYDTVSYLNEFGGSDGYTAPGDGRYIYAYQIFNDASNDYEMTNASVPYFTIEQIGAEAISSGGNIGTVDDLTGVDATLASFNTDKTNAIFEFAGGILTAGENSWFLILRSDQDWKVGTYSLDAPNDSDTVVPQENTPMPIPEPMTMGLLLGGTVVLFRRNRQ